MASTISFKISTNIQTLSNKQNKMTQNQQNKHTAFSFKKYCSSLVVVVKIVIFVRNDAEAPP